MTDARTDDQILASAETRLRFIMDDVGVPTDEQVKLYKKGFISLPIFTGMDETRAEVRQALAKEIPRDCNEGAAERVKMALLLTAWEACRRQLSVTTRTRPMQSLASRIVWSRSPSMPQCVALWRHFTEP